MKKPVEVSFDKLTAKEYYTGVVRSGSNTSARVNLPLSLIGKKVIIIVLDSADQDDRKINGLVKFTPPPPS